MQKLKRICVLFMSALLILGCSFSSYADVNNLMIGTGSNALMMMELGDSDYSVMPMSTLGTVSNTIESDSVFANLRFYDSSGNIHVQGIDIVKVDNRYRFSWRLPEGCYVHYLEIVLYSDDLPSAGKYKFGFDYASDFSYDYRYNPHLWIVQEFTNAQTESFAVYPDVECFSGDVYMPLQPVELGNVSKFNIILAPVIDTGMRNFGGSFAIHFEKTSDDGIVIGSDTSNADYQSDVSSSLSDLSSSVDSMTEDLSSAAENLEYISTSQNLIIQGIDNVVMHISDQLFAFWNQLFNLIHVPTMAKMDDIIDAIRNMDLEIEVNLDGLKQSIHQASQNEIANDNKISADQIANDEANTEEVKDAVKEHGNFIIDGLKGLFIPSDEFFKSYFDDLYAYFSDRFGFLSFPIDLVIRIADLFLTSEKVDAVLTLPSFEISGYKVWEDYSFNFTEFLETSFPFLISAIQTVTSIGLIMAFVNLCQDKWNEVMRS